MLVLGMQRTMEEAQKKRVGRAHGYVDSGPSTTEGVAAPGTRTTRKSKTVRDHEIQVVPTIPQKK